MPTEPPLVLICLYDIDVKGGFLYGSARKWCHLFSELAQPPSETNGSWKEVGAGFQPLYESPQLAALGQRTTVATIETL